MKSDHYNVLLMAALLRDAETFLRMHAQYYADGWAYFGDCRFTTDSTREFDAVMVFNTPGQELNFDINPDAVVVFMQENGEQWLHPWMFKGFQNYGTIFSPLKPDKKITQDHGYLGWSVGKSYPGLKEMASIEKNRHLSCIVSDLHILKGQRKRLEFVQKCIDHRMDFDLMGKGFRPVTDKWEGLAPYRFSLAIENKSMPHYFTEKLNDCFLARTIPVYYGCPGLEDYFPAGSFVQIDINKPEEAFEIIEGLDEEEYQKRLPDLEKARNLVLDRYQPLAKMDEILRNLDWDQEKRNMQLWPVLPNKWLKKSYGILEIYGNAIADSVLRKYDIHSMKKFARKKS